MSFDDSQFVLPGQPKKGESRARFFVEARRNNARSDLEGRAVYDDVEMVEITVPGDSRTQVVERVKAEHRERWPLEYRAFKDGREAPLSGTPLSEWAYLSPAQIANFHAINLKTIEDIAGASDGILGNMGLHARDIRERAKQYLAAAAGHAPVAALQTEKERLEAELVIARQTIADLNAALARAQTKETADA
jgi:hypothetical protein